MKSRAVISSILEADEGPLSSLTDAAYKRWQEGGDLHKASREGFVKALPEPTRMAVVFSQLIGQVSNGGFWQWIDNGYADAGIEYLIDYCDQYGDDSPVFSQLKEILDGIDEILADANGHTMRRRLNSLPTQEDFEGAVYDKDWDKVDAMLGGSDLDERRFEGACEIVLNEGTVQAYTVSGGSLKDLGDELKSEMGERPDGDTTKWSWRVIGDRGRSVFYSARDEEGRPPLFDSEEEAEEAGEDALQSLSVNDLNEDETEAVEQVALAQLAEEYARYVPDPADQFEKLDSDFYDFSDELKVAVNDVLRLEPEPEPIKPVAPATPPDYSPKGGAEDFRQESQAIQALLS